VEPVLRSPARRFPLVTVQFTRHLYSFFPGLAQGELQVQAETVAALVRALDERAPGLAFYLCDELGRLRTHVNIFIGTAHVKDRRQLSDPIPDGGTVWILQALSGG
jgi:molybdopterin converting factor small subunit